MTSEPDNYYSRMRRHGELQALRMLVKQFIDGEGRNLNFVHILEGNFRQIIDFESSTNLGELEEAFALYGAATSDFDDRMLVQALKRILPELDGLIDQCSH